MEEQLYEALLSKKKFEELMDKVGIVNPDDREKEWKSLKEIYLFEVLRLTAFGLSDEEKIKTRNGLDPNKEEDRKEYYRRVNEHILAKRIPKEKMDEIFKKAIEEAYKDYLEQFKEKYGGTTSTTT